VVKSLTILAGKRGPEDRHRNSGPVELDFEEGVGRMRRLIVPT